MMRSWRSALRPKCRTSWPNRRAPRPEVLIYHLDGPLFFTSTGHVRERVLALVAQGRPQPRFMILDTEVIFYLDATAAASLAHLTVDLRHLSCQLVMARARDSVAASLRADPYEQGITQDLPTFPSVRGAFAALQHDTR
jgi:sulfate permease, SulP family